MYLVIKLKAENFNKLFLEFLRIFRGLTFFFLIFLWFYINFSKAVKLDQSVWSGRLNLSSEASTASPNYFKLGLVHHTLFADHLPHLLCHILFIFHSPNPSHLLPSNFLSFKPFLTFHFPQNLKIPKSSNPKTFPLFLLSIRSTMVPKIGSKMQGKGATSWGIASTLWSFHLSLTRSVQ